MSRAVTLSAAGGGGTGGSHRSGHTRDRGPGGQILIHRNVQAQAKTQQKVVVTPKHVAGSQARQEIQGVLSMEEGKCFVLCHQETKLFLSHKSSWCVFFFLSVMKDLRILEDQQRESQRRLHTARLAKQRAERQHSELEAKLGELKFANGQSRALLQRMHEVLAESHKAVATMRNNVDDADRDLHMFNR